MFRNILCYISLLLFLFAINISAQQKQSLEETIEMALKENLGVKIARNNNEINQNNIHIGNAGLLPKLDLSASATYNDTELNKATPKSTNNVAGIRVSYTIFDGFANISTYSKLKTSGKMSEYETKNIIENTILTATEQYYEAARLTDQLNIAEESLNISRERLERLHSKVEYGQSKGLEYLSAEVDFNKDSVSYINTKTLLKQAKQKLNKLLNRDIDTDFIVKTEVTFETIPEKNKLILLAKERNAFYQAALQGIIWAEEEIKISQSAYLPTLSLESSYGYNASPLNLKLGFDNAERTFSAGLNLSFNIFNGFRNTIQSQNSEILLKNADLSKKNRLLDLLSSISNYYQLYVDSKTTLELEQKNLETTELNFERSKEFYDLGKITLVQFREAQLNFIRSKNNIVSLTYSIKILEIELKKLGGILI
jgi:outer membrane protein